MFTDAAIRLIYRYSTGIPRLINIICDRALLAGYINKKTQIDEQIVRKAIQEIRGEKKRRRPALRWLVGILLIVLLVAGLRWLLKLSQKPDIIEESPTSLNSESKPAPLAIVQTPPNLLSLLQTNSTNLAFLTLFKRWGLTNNIDKGVCQHAATFGLACLSKEGTWEDLRRFNRPAAIKLMVGDGVESYVVVTRLQDEVVTLTISGKTFDFNVEEISQYWQGQFLLLWQPPTLPFSVIKIGISNDSVIWVRKHLNIFEGRSNNTLSPHFDDALKQRIIAFQQKQQLIPDGVVGEQTMLVLQAFSGEEPLLYSILKASTQD